MNKYLVSLATILSLVASGNVVSAVEQMPHDITIGNSSQSSRVMAETYQRMSAAEKLELVKQYIFEGKINEAKDLLAMPNSRPELASTEIQATGEEKKYAEMDIQTDEPEFVWRSNVGLLEIGIKGELQKDSIDEFLRSKGIDKKSVLEIDVGWGVRVIGEKAFMGFESVKKISLPERLQEIRNKAFKDCKALESIDIPKGVTELGASSFYGCKSLKEVVMHSGLVRINDYAFQKCSVLEKVEIPDTVTLLGSYVFSECVGLEFARLSAKLGLISYGTFEDCSKLQEVVMFEALREISGEAFKNCSALSKLHIPNGVKIINFEAFANCTSLSEVSIMGSANLRDRVFENCSSLKKVTMPFVNYNMMTDESFYGCSNLTEITMCVNTNQGVGRGLFVGTPIYGLSLPFCDGIFTVSVKKHDLSEFA